MTDRAAKDAPSDWVIKQFEWLDQITCDTGLTLVAVRTAYALIRYFNRQTQHAWPAAATLAARLEVELAQFSEQNPF